MRRSVIFILLTVIFLGGTVLTALGNPEEKTYSPLDKRHYLATEDTVWIRPGLNLEIVSVSIPDNRKPVVTFRVTDDLKQPLDRTGILTPASISTSFVIAYLPADKDSLQYVNYIVRNVTSPITKVTSTQAATDSGGTYVQQSDGLYTYTFGTALPENYDRSATHTLGVYAARDLTPWGLSRYVANTLKHWVPAGGEVKKVREVVATGNCNQCHNPLALHGGSRQQTGLCILCHTPQTVDPDTGNTVDFKVMVHKIHRGSSLPSVKAGKPYQIIGFNQSVQDFSTVAFPRDIRNCETCHQKASQATNWYLNPTRVACGSCHDDVNFASGLNHAGGAQVSDKFCATCHIPEGELEYDASIKGAHTVPFRSTQLIRPKFEIVDITNTGPGQKPTVQFKITDKNGNAILPSQMSRLALRLAGPTTDYSWYLSESALNANSTVIGTTRVTTYTFTGTMPADAKGTYSIGIEGRIAVKLNAGTTKELTYNDGGDNVVKYFAVTGTLTPRRTVVDTKTKCNNCHDRLQLHGNNRNDTEYCVGCHNPVMTATVTAGQPNESIHFKNMVHKIHTGEELQYAYKIGANNDFSEVRFPGDRRDCATCHVNNSYTLPVAGGAEGLLPTTTPRGFWTPILPAAAACLSCHDSKQAAAHAYVNTALFGEACDVCHKEGAEFAVSKVHAR